MALFGKKKAAEPTPATPANDVSAPDASAAGAPATGAGGAAPVAAKARKSKAPKQPKASGPKSGTVVGLNIGNAYIKAVEVTSKGGQLAVTGMGVIATPPESYANGNVLSVTALSNAIRMMWKQAGLNSKATIFSVAGTGSLVVRVIEVPKMTDGELADNMRVDADRYIPFPPSEVVMDYKALRDLPSDPDAANMEVLLAAAQREIIDLHVSVIQKAKLMPRAIDVEPLALARTMQLDLRAQNPIIDYDDVTAVLNIGQTGTEISILRGDIVVFTRSVPNGGGNLTNAIAENMGIPVSDAERLKIERGDALAPAGYNEGGGEDDFGFGDFDAGGGQTVDFSSGGFDDDFGGDTATATPATDTATADAPASSDDPFDLDFFDQGPQQSEPGAGHGQKEDDEADKPTGISFSFDALDDDLSPSRSGDVTPASPPPPIESAAPAEAAPPNIEDFDLPDTYLPAMDAPAQPGADAGTVATPEPVPTMPSAFDFSDFDLPTVEQTPSTATPTQKLSDETDNNADIAAPVAAAMDTPVATGGFGFGFSDATPTAATPAVAAMPVDAAIDEPVAAAPISFANADDEAAAEADAAFGMDEEPAISLDKTDDDAVSFGDAAQSDAAQSDAAQSDMADDDAMDNGFDVDDLFGAPAEATPVAADEGGFDVGAFGAGAGDFDVSGLDVAAEDSDDFTTFGTGLSQTGEADDATLYAAMQPVLEDLATEVRRSLEFHLGRYPDTTFSRLVLVGGGAKLRNLDEFLYSSLGVPTSVGDPFAHIKVNAPNLPPEFAPTNAPLCAVALGLALRDFIE